jgi:hypothetical protein
MSLSASKGVYQAGRAAFTSGTPELRTPRQQRGNGSQYRLGPPIGGRRVPGPFTDAEARLVEAASRFQATKRASTQRLRKRLWRIP